ncbi:hypothetical protein TH63_00340 [Rufibacter radiotolerans]|uniref:DUF4251 domain-containing protein n=1 Tax=Rufibacter radiotolerans TaxID=1379910 RepID=A0A0H4VGM3_9BACT|nr:hypothetical protein [Rufibacter radiotolerans]AKQ44433.1 hypothetical protein TH63_00340 [Rufibacter radiotolerans]
MKAPGVLIKKICLCLLLLFAPFVSPAQLLLEEEAKELFASKRTFDPIEGIYFNTGTTTGEANSVSNTRIVISKNDQKPGFFIMQEIDESKSILQTLYSTIKKIDEQQYVFLLPMGERIITTYFTLANNQFVIKYEFSLGGFGPYFREEKYTKKLPR